MKKLIFFLASFFALLAGLIPLVHADTLAFIPSQEEGSISIINASQNNQVVSVTPKQKFAGIPTGIAVSPDGKKVYVLGKIKTSEVGPERPSSAPAEPGSGGSGGAPAPSEITLISVIDSQSGEIVSTIPMTYRPRATTGTASAPAPTTTTHYQDDIPDTMNLAVNADGTRLFVINKESRGISIIDLQKPIPSEIAFVALEEDPVSLALHPTLPLAYVAAKKSNTLKGSLILVDAVSAQILGKIELPNRPATIAVSQERIYVTHPFNTFDLATKTVRGTVSIYKQDPAIPTQLPDKVAEVLVGRSPVGIALSPDGSRAYITNLGVEESLGGGTVTVLERDAIKEWKIPVGKRPAGISLTSDGAFAYVINSGENTVSILDTAKLQVVQMVPVGKNPAVFGNFILERKGGNPSPSPADVNLNNTPSAAGSSSGGTAADQPGASSTENATIGGRGSCALNPSSSGNFPGSLFVLGMLIGWIYWMIIRRVQIKAKKDY